MTTATAATFKKSYPGGTWPFVALLAGNAALALGPWLVRLSDTGPIAAGFWRLALPVPLFFWLASREGPGRMRAGPVLWMLLAAGGFFALDLASWHAGIERTRLGNATLFGNSGSIIIMAWTFIAARRLPTLPEGGALIAALAGAAILLGRSLDISARTVTGDLLCLLAGGFYVLYLLPAQRARASMGGWSVLALVCAAGAPVLLVIALLAGEPVLPGPAGWGPVVGLALCSQVIGQGLLVYSLAYFPPLVVGLALLTQPALAALTGWLAFDEVLTGADLLGMGLVAAALAIARIRTAN